MSVLGDAALLAFWLVATVGFVLIDVLSCVLFLVINYHVHFLIHYFAAPLKYFYDDTPYAAWSATLFSAERHEAPACVPGMSLFSASPPPTKAAIKPSASVLSANDPSLMVHTTCSIGCTSGDTSTATSPCTHSSVPASSTSTPNSSADVLTVCVTHEAEDMNLTSLAASPMCLSGDANAAASTVLAAALAAAVPPSSCDAHEMSVAVAEQHGKSAKDDSVVTKDKDA